MPLPGLLGSTWQRLWGALAGWVGAVPIGALLVRFWLLHGGAVRTSVWLPLPAGTPFPIVSQDGEKTKTWGPAS